MARFLLLSVICFVFVTPPGGTSSVYIRTERKQSNCGSWIPYTDAKCLRITDVATLHTKKEADAVCAMLAETEVLYDVPRLVTVKSDTEQEALKQFMFEETGVLDHAWLGIDRGDDGILRWNNGSELYFNNLAEQNITGTDRQCVQMESGQGIYPMGQWVRVNCMKRNVAVCEKIQVWSAAKMQKTFLDFKSKVERQIENLEITHGVETQLKTKTLQKTPGTTVSPTQASSSCGEWKHYKNEKCFKIATHAGYQTMEDAQNSCQALSEGMNQESRLMTVKTTEEQEFLQNFLFTESKVVDKVWLGLQKQENSGKFEWKDRTNVVYSNWANQSASDDRHKCVQMASGEEIIAAGFWVRVSCKKAGIVVCEKQQTWTVEILKNMVLNYKVEQKQLEEEITSVKQRNEVSEKEITSLKQRNEASEKEINNLKRNPVPVGFIYAQLPNQEPPSSLWPQTNWADVSSSYAGLFFRVIGGQAAPFGKIQEGNTSRLEQVQYASLGSSTSSITIPPDSSWSGYIASGKQENPFFRLRFRLSGTEVRPRNQAVKIWQRTQ